MADKSLTQRVALVGGDEVRAEFKAMGDEGAASFKKIEEASKGIGQGQKTLGALDQIKDGAASVTNTIGTNVSKAGELVRSAMSGIAIGTGVAAAGFAAALIAAKTLEAGLASIGRSGAAAAEGIRLSANQARLSASAFQAYSAALRTMGLGDENTVAESFNRMGTLARKAAAKAALPDTFSSDSTPEGLSVIKPVADPGKEAKKQKDVFEELGVDVRRFADGSKESTQALFEAMAASLAQVGDSIKRARILDQLDEQLGAPMRQLLEGGVSAVKDYSDQVDAIAGKISKKELGDAQANEESFRRLQLVATRARTHVSAVFFPLATEWQDALARAFGGAGETLTTFLEQAVLPASEKIKAALGDAFAGVKESATNFLLNVKPEDLSGSFEGMGKAVSDAATIVSTVLGGAFRGVKAAADIAAEAVNAVFGTKFSGGGLLLGTLVLNLVGAFRALSPAASLASSAIGAMVDAGHFSRLQRGIISVVGRATELGSLGAKSLLALSEAAISAAASGARLAGSFVASSITSGATLAAGALRGLGSAALGVVANVGGLARAFTFEGIASAATGLVASLRAIGVAAAGAAANVVRLAGAFVFSASAAPLASISSGLSAIGTAAATAAASAWRLYSAFAAEAVAAQLTLVRGAIAGVGAAASAAAGFAIRLAGALTFSSVASGASAAAGMLTAMGTAAAAAGAAIVGAASQAGAALLSIGASAAAGAVAAGSALASMGAAAISAGAGLVRMVGSLNFGAALSGVTAFASSLASLASGAIVAATTGLISLGQAAATSLGGAALRAATALAGAVMSLGAAPLIVAAEFIAAGALIYTFWDDIKAGAAGAASAIMQGMGALFRWITDNPVWSFLSSVFSTIGEAISKVIGGLKDKIDPALEPIKKQAEAIKDAFGKGISDGFDHLKDRASEISSTVGDKLSKALEGAGDAAMGYAKKATAALGIVDGAAATVADNEKKRKAVTESGFVAERPGIFRRASKAEIEKRDETEEEKKTAEASFTQVSRGIYSSRGRASAEAPGRFTTRSGIPASGADFERPIGAVRIEEDRGRPDFRIEEERPGVRSRLQAPTGAASPAVDRAADTIAGAVQRAVSSQETKPGAARSQQQAAAAPDAATGRAQTAIAQVEQKITSVETALARFGEAAGNGVAAAVEAAAARVTAALGDVMAKLDAAIAKAGQLAQAVSASGGGSSGGGGSGGGAPGFATGGFIRGAGTGQSDEVPLLGSHGEFMTRASAVSRLGVPFFEAINESDGTPSGLAKALSSLGGAFAAAVAPPPSFALAAPSIPAPRGVGVPASRAASNILPHIVPPKEQTTEATRRLDLTISGRRYEGLSGPASVLDRLERDAVADRTAATLARDPHWAGG